MQVRIETDEAATHIHAQYCNRVYFLSLIYNDIKKGVHDSEDMIPTLVDQINYLCLY